MASRFGQFAFASALTLITIDYNIAAGAVSVFFNFKDGIMALFGFGVDFFVYVIKTLGSDTWFKGLEMTARKVWTDLSRQRLKSRAAVFMS
ncbi:MAG TPA: hypothetical protein VMM54_00805 [Nitrospirota bacterium]|nr:hypothetical protein [Nitrospirota bacterium]